MNEQNLRRYKESELVETVSGKRIPLSDLKPGQKLKVRANPAAFVPNEYRNFEAEAEAPDKNEIWIISRTKPLMYGLGYVLKHPAKPEYCAIESDISEHFILLD